MRKVKAIIKRPDEKYGHVANISVTLENLQRTVGGRIETVMIGKENGKAVLIVNEDGKNLILEPNFRTDFDVIVGTVVLLGASGDDFADCPIDFKVWKSLLDRWGN